MLVLVCCIASLNLHCYVNCGVTVSMLLGFCKHLFETQSYRSWWAGVKGKGRESERIFHLLLHFSNPEWPNSQMWTLLKSGALGSIWLSHMGAGAQGLGLLPLFSQATSRNGEWRNTRTLTVTLMECLHHSWQLSFQCHNGAPRVFLFLENVHLLQIFEKYFHFIWKVERESFNLLVHSLMSTIAKARILARLMWVFCVDGRDTMACAITNCLTRCALSGSCIRSEAGTQTQGLQHGIPAYKCSLLLGQTPAAVHFCQTYISEFNYFNIVNQWADTQMICRSATVRSFLPVTCYRHSRHSRVPPEFMYL